MIIYKRMMLSFLGMILMMIMADIARSDTRLAWDPNPSASSYTVFVREKGQVDYRIVKSGITDTSLAIVPDKFNQDYEYSVKAFSPCGNSSDYSDPVAYNGCMASVVQRVSNVKIVITIDGVINSTR